MLVISSREFRQNQKAYFEKVDAGEQVIVQRGKDKAYVLTAVKQEDLFFNNDMLTKLKEGEKQIREGKFKSVKSAEEVKNLLGL